MNQPDIDSVAARIAFSLLALDAPKKVKRFWASMSEYGKAQWRTVAKQLIAYMEASIAEAEMEVAQGPAYLPGRLS